MEKFSSCSSPSCESRSVTASAGCMSEVRKRVRRVSEYSLVRRSQDRMRLQASAVSGKSSTRQRSYLSMGRGNGIDDDRSQEKQTQEKPTNGS
jgi:predicted Zn-dependent protease